MIQFPNCKINLGLSILAKRADGYHELETVFYPIAVSDALEILPADNLTLTQTGITLPGDPSQNLCLKAYHLLKKDFPDLPPVQIHLHKNIDHWDPSMSYYYLLGHLYQAESSTNFDFANILPLTALQNMPNP